MTLHHPGPTLRGSLRSGVFVLLGALCLVGRPSPLSAQGYIGDARRVGMGGVGDWDNSAWKLVDETKGYRSIPIPLGLFQVLADLDQFNPNDDAFNPAMVLSLASNPLHYSFSRGGSPEGEEFLRNLTKAEVDTDLNSYRGFAPQSRVFGGGLWSPGWGKSFRIVDIGPAGFHSFRIAAGPYLSIETEAEFADDLIAFLENPADQYPPNTSFTALNGTSSQGAAALKLGYRGRIPLFGATAANQNGLYVSADYLYLYGIRYEQHDTTVELETDLTGRLTLAPSTPPVVIDRLASSEGRGYAIDIAGALIVDRWEFTAAIDGIGNHIDWTRVRTKQYTLDSVTDGSDFEDTSVPTPFTTLRSELPLRFWSGVTYDPGEWAATAELIHGFRGFELHGGGEYRLGWVDLRGGARYSNELLHPTWGAGFNLTSGFGVDLAFYGGASNIEKIRELSMAISLRVAVDQ